MNNRIFSVLLLFGLLTPALWPGKALAAAAEPSTDSLVPVAVLAVESYADLMADVGFLGELIDNPGLTPQSIEAIINLTTQGRGVKGLDTKRPIGVGVYTDGSQFQGFGLIPVVDLKQLLKSLGPIAGQVREKDGLIELRRPERTVYLKEVNGMAYLSVTPEALDTLPKDPGPILAALTKSYDVALQIQVKNVPEVWREIAINYFKTAFDNGMRRQPGDDDDFESRKKLIEERIAAIVAAVNATENVTLGWSLDQKSSNTSLEFRVLAKAGSPLATQFSSNAQATSTLTALIPADLPLSGLLSSKLSAEEQTEAINQLTVARDELMKKIDDALDENEEMEKAAEALVDELIESVKTTIKTGKRDIAASVMLGDTLSLTVGAYAADSAGVEKAFKKFAAVAAKSYPDAPRPKFDAETAGGVRFHTASVPVEDDDTANVLGDNLDIALGIGPKHVYLAVGKQALASLKKTLVASPPADKPTTPLQITAAITPILKFVAGKIKEDDPQRKIWAKVVAASKDYSGKDKIKISSSTEGPSLTLRLEIEENVIRLGAEAQKIAERAKSGDEDQDK